MEEAIASTEVHIKLVDGVPHVAIKGRDVGEWAGVHVMAAAQGLMITLDGRSKDVAAAHVDADVAAAEAGALVGLVGTAGTGDSQSQGYM